MNIQTATPVEIDTVLAEIYGRGSKANFETARCDKWLVDARKDLAEYQEAGRDYYVGQAQERVARLTTELAALRETEAAIWSEAAPFDKEFARRGGWNRFFLVRNNNGHVHSSMRCQTCFPDTLFAWLPEFSGQDEAGIVELAGESACTVCFPSAPVDVLSRRSQIELPERKAARLEREAKAAAKAVKKAAAAIPTTKITSQGSWTEKLETISAARNRLTDHYQYVEVFGWAEFITAGLDDLVSAIATKEGKTSAQVIEEARKRAAKRK